MIEALGELRLLAQAYRRQDALSDGLRHDVRALVGWSTRRAEFIENPNALRVSGQWVVLGTLSETQADKLVRLETWLMNTSDATGAVLMDFVPASAARGAASSFTSGQQFEAELVFYPSATPQSAVILEQSDQPPAATYSPVVEQGLAEALAAFDESLVANPWLPRRLLACTGTGLAMAADGSPWLTDAQLTDSAVPLAGKVDVTPLMGLPDLTAFGLFDGRSLVPLAAQTPLGWWWADHG
jgi:hypothetical protein